MSLPMTLAILCATPCCIRRYTAQSITHVSGIYVKYDLGHTVSAAIIPIVYATAVACAMGHETLKHLTSTLILYICQIAHPASGYLGGGGQTGKTDMEFHITGERA